MKIRILLIVLLFAATSAVAQIPSYVPSNGLVGWWPFNGNANDESGNGNNGTVNGATLTQDRNGVNNSAFTFNGTSTFIEVPSTNLLQLSSNYSIGLWYNPALNINNAPYGYTLLSKITPTGWYGGYEIMLGTINPNGEILHTGNIDNSNFILGPHNGISQGIWQFVVVSYDGVKLKLYSNGQYVDSLYKAGSLQIGSDPLRFGRRGGGTIYNQWYSGILDDIGIWNRALTQQEITALYNAQSCTSNTITADGPTTFCAGNSVTLTSDVVGGTYQWKKNGVNIATNSTSRTFKASSTGSYTCVATCNGTTLTSNAIAVTSKTNASATVSASGATSFCAGDSVTLNCTNLGSNYSVQWYRSNISIENATAFTRVVKQPGTYKVVTKNLTTGCSRISGSSAVVAVSCRLANPDVIAADITESDFVAKGINEEPKGKIYIYPNPTSDNKFTVELMGLEVNGNATLEVYNAMGQLLSSEKVNITNGSLNRTIQIDEQSRGQLCLVRLMTGSEVYDSKVILK